MEKARPPKILIVGDDVSIRNVLNEYLVDQGYQTYCAATSDDALDYLLSKNIDIVISDISRPDLDGLKFMQRVKSFCDTKFIIVSGTILNNFRTPEECFAAGASAVMKKPALLTDLLTTIKKLTDSTSK